MRSASRHQPCAHNKAATAVARCSRSKSGREAPFSPEPRSDLAEQVVQALKDKAHKLLLGYCEVDPDTGCWIWTRSWHPRTEHGLLWVAGRAFTTHRVAYWVYVGGFDLFDPTVRIYHRRCQVPACFNYEHLARAHGPDGVRHALVRLGRVGAGTGRPRKLSA